MFYVLLFELIALFLLSRILTTEVSMLFYKVFHSERISSWLLAVIFLPGTIIHELSHAVAAKLVFVPVGKVDLMPKLYGNSLKLGSVEVGKSDIFRDFFIGIAPFVIGSSLLVSLLYFSFTNQIFGFNYLSALVIYGIFVISNTMYSSSKDMEGAVEFLAIILIPIAVLYFSGIKIDMSIISNLLKEEFLEHAVYLMLAPLLINIGVIAFAKTLNRS